MRLYISLLSLSLAILYTPLVWAIPYPSTTPTGEVGSGTFNGYFTNMFTASGCSGSDVVRGFTPTGILLCTSPSSTTTWLLSGTNVIQATTGSVGIGTSTPWAKLEIAGSQDNLLRLNKTSGGNYNYIEWLVAGTRKYWTGLDASGVFNIQSDSASPVVINAGGGNVGIGMTTPANKLHVSWAIGATDWIWAGCETNCESGGGYSILYPNGTIVATTSVTAPSFVGNLTGNATTATTSSSTNLINSPDGDRNASTKLPNTTPQWVRFDFANASTAGTAGNYAGVMTYAPWLGTTASTGDASYQLAFGSTAANGGGIPMLNIRKGIDSTWNSWYTILHSGNFVSSNQSSPVNANNVTTNGTYYANANVWLFGQTDGALYAQAYDPNWVGQIYQDYRTWQIALRGKNNGTWQSWRTVLDSSSNIWGLQSGRDFPQGTLIQTDIDYSVTNGEPWLLEIEGNSYGSLVPFDLKYQGYIYSNTVINHGGISNGTNITGMSLFNLGGKLAYWFPYQSYWQWFTVQVNDSYAGSKKNRVTAITNIAKPGGITKEVAMVYNQSVYANTAGNVGIGLWTPWARLDIAGNVKITDGTQWAGKVLTSDASGLASWITPGAASSVPWTGITGAPAFATNNVTGRVRMYEVGCESGWGSSCDANTNGRVDIADSTTLAANSTLAGGINPSNFHRNDVAGDWQMASATNSSSYSNAALEVRELNFAWAQSAVASEAPRIAFHWSARVASQIGMGADGVIRTFDNPGTGYENFAAKNIVANGTVQITGGAPGAGKVLTSDASGLASWQTATSSTTWAGVTAKSLGDTARSDSTLDIGTSQYMRWKNYGNGHVIIDASNGTSPSGSAINQTNSQVPWSWSYPTLMGWNGANTYGVRVDSARVADIIPWAGVTSKPTTIAGYGITDALDLPSSQNIPGIKYFLSNKWAGSYVGWQNTYALEAFSNDGGAAGMSFHRGGAYAVNMGLDPDNVIRIGGWSAPANIWQLDMAGNQTVAGRVTANAGLTVSEAWWAYTYITLKDDESPNGIKYIHANSNVMWFLNGYGSWMAYWDNNGNQQNQGSINVVWGVTANDMTNNGWYRSNGNAGWYSNSYWWGWWMTDPTWIRSYGWKYMYVDSIIQAGAYMNSPAYYYISDARLKKDLVKITSSLDKVNAMNGYYFKWKKDDKKDLGLIAQEVEKIFPDAVWEYTDPDSKKTYKNVEYGHLIAPVIEAIKELTTLVKSNKADIVALRSENESLKKRLDAIEARLGK